MSKKDKTIPSTEKISLSKDDVVVKENVIGKFWMVWRLGGSNPSKMHRTKEEAATEAVRLAHVDRQADFFVLEAISVTHNTAIKTTVLK